jgi:5-methyltetrahydrofolate--homocysteine methyltransferase
MTLCRFNARRVRLAGQRVASNQAGIWKLLRPEEIGVQLTEGFMMDPEASVSALVFHHPDCAYFGVGDTGE